MTRQAEFKRLIRERMRKTGESYTSARAQLLDKSTRTDRGTASDIATTVEHTDLPAGVFDGYPRFGGVQSDIAVLGNVAEQSGVLSPIDGTPYSEALLTGLCDGIGFMYFVFEYQGHAPMLTIGARAHSTPDVFVGAGIERIGAQLDVSETGGARTARRALDAALERRQAAVCVVDRASLPYHGMPAEWRGHGPHVVGIAGADGDDVWLDDGSVKPMRLSLEQLGAARAAHKKSKHRLITMQPLATDEFDLPGAVLDAIRATVRGFHEAPYANFAGNFGLAGLARWRTLMTDSSNKKGWPTVFADSASLWAGLRRVHECIQHDYTAPAGGRPLYGDFLEEAAGITGRSEFAAVADEFRASGERWETIATRVRDSDPAVRRGCELSAAVVETLDTLGSDAGDEIRRILRQRRDLAADCTLTVNEAAPLFEELASLVAEIEKIERGALERLQQAAS